MQPTRRLFVFPTPPRDMRTSVTVSSARALFRFGLRAAAQGSRFTQPRARSLVVWWAVQDSNLRLRPCDGRTLPTELTAPPRGNLANRPGACKRTLATATATAPGPQPRPSLRPLRPAAERPQHAQIGCANADSQVDNRPHLPPLARLGPTCDTGAHETRQPGTIPVLDASTPNPRAEQPTKNATLATLGAPQAAGTTSQATSVSTITRDQPRP